MGGGLKFYGEIVPCYVERAISKETGISKMGGGDISKKGLLGTDTNSKAHKELYV